MFNYIFGSLAKAIVYGTTIITLGGTGTGIILSKRADVKPTKLEIQAQESQIKPEGVKSNDNENCTAAWPYMGTSQK